MVRGLKCGKDTHIWGDFPRSLDWGTWHPDYIFVDLPFPKITTRLMGQTVQESDLIAFIKEYRRVNAGSSMAEAKEDFHWLQEQQEAMRSLPKE
ncbi:hypothetical protein SU48_10700 [Deinococcus puniceus]|uniref:Uncharacterized protein n=2 Tax=Deinococcus puniceus TaxID=1182568 RepID=A0A172TAZ1_9DEIO|nr:hypothetical protein SU48_10700 [Deinococcus puniceus]